MLRRAFDAGVPLLCGTESGFSITPYGEWHYRELEVFVRDLGLTPLQAIKAATSDNAVALRLEGQTGAIEIGRLADIIVVDGDPVADVTVLGEIERIKQVYVGGVAQPTGPITPDRQDPPGWRVSHYGDRILNYGFVHDSRR
jgi:imidazolonepropionase-like amidohydrolase